MLARQIAEGFPLVQLSDEAFCAARLLATQRLPGVVVVDEGGAPVTVLPGSQVLRFLVPGYVQEGPSLAMVFDERTADACAVKLAGKRVRDLLPPQDKRAELPIVDGSVTVMECAARMARLRSPLLAVVDRGRVLGVITAAHLLELLLPTG